jgi:hypothetical protein
MHKKIRIGTTEWQLCTDADRYLADGEPFGNDVDHMIFMGRS